VTSAPPVRADREIRDIPVAIADVQAG